jgi:MFS family permease
MMAAAILGPLFFLLVLTMPRGRKPAVQSETRAGDGVPMQNFLPYVKAHWRSLVCVYGSIFAMAVSMTSCLIWFPLALPRVFHIDPTTVGVGLGAAIAVATVVGVLMPVVVLWVRRRATNPQPLAIARVFVWLTPLPAAFLPFITSPFQAYCIAAVQGALGVACSSLMPGVLQDLAPPHLRSRVLAILGIANALALAVSPITIGFLSGLMPSPRGILLAITAVSLPSLAASAVLISLASRPFAATVRAIRSELLEHGA